MNRDGPPGEAPDLLERLFVKLELRHPLAPEHKEAIRWAITEYRQVPSDRTLVRQGEGMINSTLLLDGFAGRFKDLRGGQRQIMELNLAGDFVDLHSFTLKKMDHGITTFTPCVVGVCPHDRLKQITDSHPLLTRLFWFSTNLDASIHREWVLSLGQRNALARTAHLFCELRARLEIVGLATRSAFDLPLTQGDLAECLGLTPIHVNRMLKELRQRELLEMRQKRVVIHDLATLERAAEFDPAYLYLGRVDL